MLHWLSDPQFLRPLWLGVIPVIALWFWLQRRRQRTAGWGSAIAQKNLRYLQVNQTGRKFTWLPYAAMCIACLALAGPGSESIPGKTGHASHARIHTRFISINVSARHQA